jgi:PncC family amidohydrolase
MQQTAELAQQIVATMTDKKLTLGVVESCTGGQLAAAITAVPGASAVLRGGIVAYSNAIKAQLLGVDWSTMDDHGAVSEECARELAENGSIALRGDYTIATTGIAGPDGGTDDKPVGTVYIAWSGPAGTEIEHGAYSGDRAAVQRQAVERALAKLAELLEASATAS